MSDLESNHLDVVYIHQTSDRPFNMVWSELLVFCSFKFWLHQQLKSYFLRFKALCSFNKEPCQASRSDFWIQLLSVGTLNQSYSCLQGWSTADLLHSFSYNFLVNIVTNFSIIKLLFPKLCTLLYKQKHYTKWTLCSWCDHWNHLCVFHEVYYMHFYISIHQFTADNRLKILA